MEGFFSREYYIENYMCDKNGNLLPAFALKLVQSVSCQHCETMGVYEKITQRGQVFLITKQLCEFSRQIKAGETVILHSTPLLTSRGIFPRMTYFESRTGERIGYCDARWFLLDKEKMRPLRKMDDDIFYPATLQLPLEPIAFPKEATEFLRTENVRYSQIDSNGHLNNTEYLNYLSDTLPNAEFFKFQVAYKKEIKDGVVRLEATVSENQIHLCGFNGDDRNFEILAQYRYL